MTVFRLNTNDSEYTSFRFACPEDVETVDSLIFNPLLENHTISHLWPFIPIVIDYVRKDTDFALINDEHICISHYAKNILSNVVGDSIEFLPLKSDYSDLFLLRVIPTSHLVLGLEQSAAIFVPRMEKLISISSFSFQENLMLGKVIFSIKGLYSEYFVTDTFKDIYDNCDLKGLEFSDDDIVWRSI